MSPFKFKPFSFFLLGVLSYPFPDYAGTISSMPLFLTTSSKSNTLVILDDSNSMDENPNGSAVGSNNAASKSLLARGVIQSMISSYTGKINMGLMSYQQSNVAASWLHNSQYDASYNPANYDASFTGARDAITKRFRISNPTSAGNYIYYNVDLPFYDNTGSQGNGFCYSTTAKAFNNGENPVTGPWDTYRCFNTKTGTADIWNAVNPWGNAGVESSYGLTGFNFQSSFYPTDSDLAQSITDFGKQLTWQYVGRAYSSVTSPGRGYLNNPIRLLDSTQASAINTNLACNIPTTPAPCTTTGIKNAGNTPIEGTLYTANDYFAGNLSASTDGFVAGQTYPLPQSCNKNFIIFVTDGLPDTDRYGVINSNPTTTIAAAATAAGVLKNNGIETYIVGFALPVGTDPATLNTIASAGGTSTAYLATDQATLFSALDAIYKDILSKTNSFSALANNGPQISTSSLLFQTLFDATDWSGDVYAWSVNADGTVNKTAANWQASQKFPAAAARNIFTYNPNAVSGSVKGIPFQWASLTTAPAGSSQQDYLNKLNGVADAKGSLRLSWLRGDQSGEQKNGGVFRNRLNILGDIVDSNPAYVDSSQDYDFIKLPGTEGSSYATFRSSTAYTSRIAMLYVGANDGMLHGFNAQKITASGGPGGNEVLAYVPNVVFPQLSSLTAPNYQHQYFVDGLNAVSDAYVDTNSDGISEWHTLLAGTTGAGGQAVFSLDITSPSSFGAANVLWEFSNANDPDLGYTLTQPAIARMHDGSWVAIVANGYNSSNGKAVLYILNAATGAVIKKIDTGTGSTASPNGLSSPVAADIDNDRIVDFIYAGDLQGNLWKFDVSGASPAQWDVAYKPSGVAVPLFVACASSGTTCAAVDRQPITAQPIIGPVGADQVSGLMIYFGTGKYYETTDNVVGSSPQVEAFYGLWDKNTKTAAVDRITDTISLQPQTIDVEGYLTSSTGVTSQQQLRITSNNAFCYTTTSPNCASSSSFMQGWMLRLLTPPAPGIAKGERVFTSAALYYNEIVFSTTIPSNDPCQAGGTSFQMIVDARSGRRTALTVFDAFQNGLYSSTSTASVSGVNLGLGITGQPNIMQGAKSDKINFNGSTGGSGSLTTDPCRAGRTCQKRISWRQLR